MDSLLSLDVIQQQTTTSVPGTSLQGYSEQSTNNQARRQLNEFRKSDTLCDVTLQSNDGKQFRAHSIILAASSSVFFSFFSTNNCLQATSILSLNGLSGVDMAVMLDYIYGAGPSNAIEVAILYPVIEYLEVTNLWDNVTGV